MPHSLPSKETQKVACISDPENAKTVAGTVLTTAPTTVFGILACFSPGKQEKPLLPWYDIVTLACVPMCVCFTQKMQQKNKLEANALRV